MTKAAGYYENDRADAVAEIPPPLGRVLDVGCGAGAVGGSLRRAGAARVEGIELEPGPAERAAAVLDAVHVGRAEDLVADGEVAGPFDTIVLYDVLEHLPDPGALLRALHGVAAPGARVHVSIPNARHFSLVADLVFRGTFGYTDWGHRDSTHLRWFTRRDMEALLAETGWQVRETRPALLGRNRVADRMTAGLLREFLAVQWHVLAQR